MIAKKIEAQNAATATVAAGATAATGTVIISYSGPADPHTASATAVATDAVKNYVTSEGKLMTQDKQPYKAPR
jgi:hypothetical protein